MKTKGEELFLQGKCKEAFEVLQTETEGRSFYLMGTLLREGWGVDANEKEANSFFQKGMEKGNPLAALCLLQSVKEKEMWDIVNTYLPKALEAATQDDVLAMEEVGRFYTEGGIILNGEEGMKWISKAALFEYWRAFYDLGMAYVEGKWLVQDLAKAEKCFESAGKYHHGESLYQLAELKREKTDPETLENLYKESYEAGYQEAGIELAELMMERTNGKEGMEILFALEQKGNTDVLPVLGNHYMEGFGVPEDPVKAEYYYNKTILEGEELFGHLGLSMLYEKLRDEASTKKEKQKWHEKALEQQNFLQNLINK